MVGGLCDSRVVTLRDSDVKGERKDKEAEIIGCEVGGTDQGEGWRYRHECDQRLDFTRRIE